MRGGDKKSVTVLEALRESGVFVPDVLWDYDVRGPSSLDGAMEILVTITYLKVKKGRGKGCGPHVVARDGAGKVEQYRLRIDMVQAQKIEEVGRGRVLEVKSGNDGA